MAAIHIKTILVASLCAVVQGYDIRSEPLEQRQMICNNQVATCNTFCVQKVASNKCIVESMVYECVCADFRVPTEAEITLPVPYFICSGSIKECYAKCANESPGDSVCTDRCNQTWKCDKLKRQNTTAPVPPPPMPIQTPTNPPSRAKNSAASLNPALGMVGVIFAGLTGFLA